ncbi:MAG: hypothetical protein EBT30_08530, partial [Verrucomicrobia bacterium]|nr:hypothetical protein [Verrucomicrobiota bacterium]
VARMMRGTLRNRLLPDTVGAHLPTQVIDSVTLGRLRLPPAPQQTEDIVTVRTRLASGLEHLNRTQLAFNGNGLNAVNISGNGNSTLTFNVADVTGNANADLTVTANLQNSRGVLSSLNKAGAGLMVLAGSNSYTGSTTVSGGTLQVGNGGTTGNLGTANGVTLSNGATLAFNRTDSYGGNFTQAVSGAGGVALSAGTLTLQNTSNNFTGGVAVNGGTFYFCHGRNGYVG